MSVQLCWLCLSSNQEVCEPSPKRLRNSKNTKPSKLSAAGWIALVQIVHGHDNPVSRDDAELCVCKDCAILTEQSSAIGEQIVKLKTQLKETIALIRDKILESEHNKKLSDSDQDLESVRSLRQIILDLFGDESQNHLITSADLQVKLEVDDNHHQELDDEDYSDFMLHPESGQDFKLEDDQGQVDLVAESRSTGRNGTKVANHRKKIDNHKSKSRPARKRGRPNKLETSQPVDEHHSNSEEEAKYLSSDSSEIQDQSKIKCTHCPIKFNTQESLDSHVAQIHSSSCRLCHATFKTKSLLRSHLKSEHKCDTPHQCPICRKLFTAESPLATHLFLKHETEDKPFFCGQCGKKFTLQLNLDRHIKLHELDDSKPFSCSVCDSRFKDEERLQKHLLTHNVKVYDCQLCSKTYADARGLEVHLITHTGVKKQFKCDHCDEKFSHDSSKQRHMSLKHASQDEQEPKLCSICGSGFLTLDYLKAHLKRHEGTQRIKCELCKETFSLKKTLESHRIKVHGADPLICDECGAKFTTVGGLKLHKMSHAGEKPHKCDMCPSAFLRKSHLNKHQARMHREERAFICQHCGNASKTKDGLDSHQKLVHSGSQVKKGGRSLSKC